MNFSTNFMFDTVPLRRLKFKAHPGSNVRFVDELILGKNLTQMPQSILKGYYIEILYAETTYTKTGSTVLSNKS